MKVKKKKKTMISQQFPIGNSKRWEQRRYLKVGCTAGWKSLTLALGVFADYLETWYIVPRLVNVSVTFFNFIIVTAPLKLDSCMKLCAFWSSSKDIIAIFFPFDRELALARKLSILKNISDTVHRWPEGNPCYLNLSVRPAFVDH